nr:patatin-like phospholipase RssA [Sansalvadorimonas sp. 2012CJ34-2]
MALGSGSARGWAHIGVIKALKEMGVEADVVAGCSVGSLVGAAGACGFIDEFEDWVLSLKNWREVWGLVDVGLSGGLVRGEKLLNFFRDSGVNMNIEDMPCAYGAIATDLATGQERWLRTGPVLDAIRASCTFPGLFQPVETDGHWLLDGGLVNPVPVSLCRALGADIVIAVDLNTQIVNRHVGRAEQREHLSSSDSREKAEESKAIARIKSWFAGPHHRDEAPGIFDVMAASINIMQDRITRSRMAGDPPDLQLSPRLMDIGMVDFDRAGDAIREGYAVVNSARSRIIDICGLPS